MGVYPLWRDLGYAAGALIAGAIAAVRMGETLARNAAKGAPDRPQ